MNRYKEIISRAKRGGKHGVRALGLINGLKEHDCDDYERLERIDEIMAAYNEVCTEGAEAGEVQIFGVKEA
ncbi:hypothetical protein GNQ08_27095 [Paenibacillus macerans]|uniref:Uncharacterized protein n=1 Tax=Paenibacillus macerans TaxID=44252 RepID=A0A6N8F6H0_PAEMA|nr:hypothetical protein [Paenibacillus macerans]MDU5945483.1 hypothetical protein [Paenibacillus macerans]MUG26032.1 hypothetical protein [Paenibacillus macerans]